MCLALLGALLLVQTVTAASGDPGGQIMNQLQPVTAALPGDAQISYRNDFESHWDSCDGRPGTLGWSEVVVQVHFVSHMDPARLLVLADQRLSAEGWHGNVGPAASAPAGAWSRSLKGGSVAHVQVEKDSYGQNEWTLFATAPPHGRQASGC